MKYVHKGALIRKVTDEEAERLKQRGFKELKSSEQPAQTESDTAHETDWRKLNKSSLIALAEEKGIEVPEKATKDDIIKILEEEAVSKE